MRCPMLVAARLLAGAPAWAHCQESVQVAKARVPQVLRVSLMCAVRLWLKLAVRARFARGEWW